MKVIPVLIYTLLAACRISSFAQDAFPTDEEVASHVLSQAENYFAEFQHPDTGILYGSRLSGKDSWTSPGEVLKEIPHPWGYGSRFADTALHTGHMLLALLDAWEARPDPRIEKQIRKHFAALKLIGSLPETHPKPGKPALEGLVPRGPHPDDHAAWYDDSSMDQHTTYIISLALFSQSDLASDADKKWIRKTLGAAGRRLEKHGWSILRADGVTQAHVGFSWKGFNSGHASILLPSVLALHAGTGDQHWKDLYEFFLAEGDGKRWELSHPGPHVKINGHPIYANQNAFRVNAWFQLEHDPKRREVIGGLLRQSVEMQLSRDFPSEFYRKYQSDEVWTQVRADFNWGDADLHGASSAWKKFQPRFLDHKERGMAALAHVRFPLGGYHMVLLSEQPDLIQQYLPELWQMLTTVDLKKISAGETHYLFSVVGLHLYALHFKNPDLFNAETSELGPELPIIASAGIGGVSDVKIVGQMAYAIGKGRMHLISIENPDTPVLESSISGLGNVRQLVVADGFAYVSSRQDGLFVVDVSNPRKPELLTHYDTVEFATGLAISGDILFVACRHYGVELIDISKPDSPRHLSTVRTGEAQSVVARDGLLYTGVWATSEIVTVDFKDPLNPTIVSRVDLDGYGDGVDVDGDLLFAATGHHSKDRPKKEPGDPGFGKGHGLEIFDLSNPEKPVWISRIKFPPLYEIGNDTWRVTVTNQHAFVTDTYNGLFVVDVSNPKTPRCVGHHQLPQSDQGKPKGFVGGLALTTDRILIAGGDSDLHVVSAPGIAKTTTRKSALPIKIPSSIPITTKPGWRAYRPDGQVHSVSFLPDNRAVVACGHDGIHLLTLWPEIQLLSKTPTNGFATDVSVHNDLIFAAESSGGLSIYRIGEENSLIHLSQFSFRSEAIRQVEVPGNGNYALLQAGGSRFLILDVTDPAAPELVLEETRHGLLYGDQMMRGLVEDRYTAVFWHVAGLHWYDLGARPSPVFSGDIFPHRIGSPNGHFAIGGKSIATLRGGFLQLSRKERRSVEESGTYQVGSLRHHLGVPTVSENLLFAANRAEGKITSVDITNPEDPKLLELIQTSGNPSRVAVRNGSLIVPDGYNGLQIRDQLEK